MYKMFMLLYVDDIVIFANSAEELQQSLDVLINYCNRWKITVNVSKTNVMVFRKCGMLTRNMAFFYDGERYRNSQRIQISRHGFHNRRVFSEAHTFYQNTIGFI